MITELVPRINLTVFLIKKLLWGRRLILLKKVTALYTNLDDSLNKTYEVPQTIESTFCQKVNSIPTYITNPKDLSMYGIKPLLPYILAPYLLPSHLVQMLILWCSAHGPIFVDSTRICDKRY